MNKVDLAEELAQKSNLPKNQVLALLESFQDAVISALKDGKEVTLTGFGSFMAKARSARWGVNPLNPKEKIRMPETRVAKFKTGKVLKEALRLPKNQ